MPEISPRKQFRIAVWLCAALLTLCLLSSVSYADKTTQSRQIAPGVTYTQEITRGSAPLLVNLLIIDLKAPGVRVRCGQALDNITEKGATKGRESIPALAARAGAVAAVNADFFPFTGDPLGIAIRDGELLSEPMAHRAGFGIGPNGAFMDVLVSVASLTLADSSETPLGGINRVPVAGESVVLTPTFAATPTLKRAAVVITLNDVNLPVQVSKEMQGTIATVAPFEVGEALPLCAEGRALIVADGKTGEAMAARCKPGDTVKFRFDLASNGQPPRRGRYPSRAANFRATGFTPAWGEVEQAVGGGPFLLRNGQIAIDGEAEAFDGAGFVEKRHPRTAVGTTADGKLLLLTVDGRQEASQGASLPELAKLMKRFGAVDAINLDGGGSTTMVVGGGVVNAPSDGRARPVANGLLVFADVADAPGAELYSIIDDVPANHAATLVGASSSFRIVRPDGKPLPADTPVVWGTADGLGFISQKGEFTSYRAGKGKVVARIGTRALEIPVTVLPGAVATLKATLGAAANNPPDRSLLTVTALDKYGNPLAGVAVQVSVRGGQALSALKTDAKGVATTEVVWNADAKETSLTLSAGSAPPVTVPRKIPQELPPAR